MTHKMILNFLVSLLKAHSMEKNHGSIDHSSAARCNDLLVLTLHFIAVPIVDDCSKLFHIFFLLTIGSIRHELSFPCYYGIMNDMQYSVRKEKFTVQQPCSIEHSTNEKKSSNVSFVGNIHFILI